MSGNRLPVTVIVVTFNTKELTLKALRALYLSSELPSEVIVVDNKSDDGTQKEITKEFSDVKYIKNNENVGFAKANNQAIKLATQPYIWLLNSDTEIGSNTMLQLVEYLEKNENVGSVGPSLVYPDGSLQSPGGYFPTFANVLGYLLPVGFFLPDSFKQKMRRIALYPQKLPKEGLEMDYVTGAACMFRKKALDEVGLLGEEYFMYFEETDLFWRLKQKKWRVVAIQTDPVMHIYGGSFKTKRDERRLRLFLESLVKFVNKNYNIGKAIPIRVLVWFLGNISIYLKTRRKV